MYASKLCALSSGEHTQASVPQAKIHSTVCCLKLAHNRLCAQWVQLTDVHSLQYGACRS